MYFIVEIISTLAIVLIIHLFLQGVFTKRQRCAFTWITAYLIYGLGLTLIGQIPSLAMFRLIYNTSSAIILALFLFEAKAMSSIYAGISISALCVLSEMLMMSVLAGFGLDTETMMSHTSARYICSLAVQTVTLLLVMIVLALTRKKRSAVTLPFILMLSPGCIIGIWLGCEFGRIVLTEGEYHPLPFLLASIGLIYMNILLVFYAERVKETSQRQKEAELAEHHYEMQEQYYEQLRTEQNETRAMFHDINKYLCAMRALVEKNHEEQAVQVFESAQTIFDSLGNVVDVGNSVINVILSEYKTLADEEDISFEFDVSVPSDLGITEVDAYILLGNTLDNAIEACCSLPNEQRYIKLQLKQFHEILFFQIENPFSSDYHKRVKGKKHGYGLKNDKKCVEKYHGDLTYSSKEYVFVLSARLNVHAKSNLDLHVLS